MYVKSPLSEWFEKAFIRYQYEIGERASLDKFAALLGISRGYLSQLMNGDKKGMGRNTAIVICQKLNDFSLLDILGYARPQPEEIPIPFSSLPPELQSLLRSALLEIEQTLRTRSIQPDSPEGLEISISVMKKYGFNFNSIRNDE